MTLALRYPHDEAPAFGAAKPVAEGVFWARMPLPKPLGHINVFAIDDGDGWTLIDTGVNSDETRGLWETLLAGPLAGKPVRRVIVTHHHLDHVGLAGWFVAQGAELLMSRTAYLMARMLQLDVQDRYPPETLAFYRSAGMAPEIYDQRQSERPFNTSDRVAPMPLGYTRLQAGEVIRIGGRDWDIRMGHGHAPEHATFWSRNDALVIGGDQLLPGISANIGVYPTEPEADPLGEWLDSCATFLPFAEAEQLVLPGHKLPFTGLPLRLRQMIDGHLSALDRLLDHLETPAVAGGCFAPLFKRAIGPGEYGLALVEAVAHLNYLYARGKVRRERAADGSFVWQRVL